MNVVAWIIFGLIAGVVANLIDPAPARGGVLGAIVLGIVGAIVGGWIGAALFGVGVTGFNLNSFVIAVVGALLVLVAGRMLSRVT